jgi:hypothetical protein
MRKRKGRGSRKIGFKALPSQPSLPFAFLIFLCDSVVNPLLPSSALNGGEISRRSQFVEQDVRFPDRGSFTEGTLTSVGSRPSAEFVSGFHPLSDSARFARFSRLFGGFLFYGSATP